MPTKVLTPESLAKAPLRHKTELLSRYRTTLGLPGPEESPASFLIHARKGRWRLAPHLEYMNGRLVAASLGRTRRLIIVMPPRHGKSEMISAGTSAWWIGTHPEQRVMLASYATDFAASWGRKARDLLELYGPEVFGVNVSEVSSAADRWDIQGHMGGMTTAGIGGSFTGRGANLLLIDDPLKNSKEAMSRTIRDAHWEWFLSTAYTRLEPDAIIIVIMTRWHEDDLVGRILRESTEPWEVIWLPALAMQGDQLGRAEGEALWPWRFDEKSLERIKSNLGSYYWSAMYQGLPVPEGGALFKRAMFRYAERLNGSYALQKGEKIVLVPTDKCITFQTVDLAVSTEQSADYTVVATWAQTPDRDLILLDITRDRIEGPDQLSVVANLRQRFGAAKIGIEKTQYQLSFVQSAVRAGLPAVGLKTDGNKFARALSIAARYEAGAVYHMKGPWLNEYESELLSFDKGEHDDQVDAAAYAAQFLMDRGSGVKVSVVG